MLDVLATSRDSCATAKTCGLVHTGSGAYGVPLMAVGILLLGVALLALTWRRRPSMSVRASVSVSNGASARARRSEEPDARDAYLAGDA